MTTVIASAYGLNMWESELGVAGRTVIASTPSLYSVSNTWASSGVNNFHGFGFTYDDANRLTGGVVTGWEASIDNGSPTGLEYFSFEDFSVPATRIADWLATGDDDPPVPFPWPLFSGADSITGGPNDDDLWGGTGDDTILGGGGDDGIAGGYAGTDRDGSNYLRGGDGNDTIHGADAFDDINGNAGDDQAYGGPGDDWVLGGQGNDKLLGDDKLWTGQGDNFSDLGEGADFVHGNLGDDTCDGGPGADTVRGGQGDDSLTGSAGDDWLSGDRGSDTLSGGAGADVFHSFGEAGLDRVLDFNRAEGDRVQLDPGTTYTVSQSGADVVIDMAGGARMVLAGVQLSTLSGDWIFTA
jgi:serralysin